jgi:glycosyltransferase involved in cell wall biosynthesis
VSPIRIGVALVTHNAGAWLQECLLSISVQSRGPDRIVVVDDQSTDNTRALVRDFALQGLDIELQSAHTTSTNVRERIAANFFQAVHSLQDNDFVALGDHDDVWQPLRLEHQSNVLEAKPHAVMLASDGQVIDESGLATKERLRTMFPIPADFQVWRPRAQLRWVLRRSVAVGGASMIRPRAISKPPSGWLHDRWWSIEAASQAGFIADDEVVIHYRKHPVQQIGGDQGRQHLSGVTRARTMKLADMRRLRDVHSLARTCAPECRSELTYPRLLRTFLGQP